MRRMLVVAGAAVVCWFAPNGWAIDTVVVNAGVKYQTMRGWEAHARAWQVDKLRNAYDPSWQSQAPAIAARMVNELGINRIQVPLRSGWQNPVDYWAQFTAGTLSYTAWKSHNYEKSGSAIQFSEFDFLIETSVLPMAAALAARGEKLYVNLGYGDFNTPGFLQGTLSLAANPAAYASFVQVFFDRLKSKYGITADALELLNEPENTAWTGTQIGQALVAAKAKLVAAGYVGLNYIGPSPSSAGNMQPMANALLAVPGAAQALTTLSYHRYDSPGAGAVAALDAYAKAKGLQLDMSEWINATADTLHEDLTVGNVASWQKWAIADRKEAGRTNPQAFYYLCDISTSPPTITLAPNSAFLAQYFRYVRMGAVRIAAQSSVAARRPVAFQNANGNQVVVVKTAAGTGSQPVTFSGLRPGVYGVRTTNFSEQAADLPDVVAAADGSLTIALADGFTTLYGKGASPPAPPPPPPPAPGALSLATAVTFANQTVGTTSAARTVTMTNVGGTAVTVQGIASNNASEFTIASSTCGTVNPAASCNFAVVFKPAAVGARAATLTVTSNGVGSPQTMSASGSGLAVPPPPPPPPPAPPPPPPSTLGKLSFAATAAFASQTVGTVSPAKTITLTNIGGKAVTVQGIVSSNASEFTVTSSACGTVAPAGSCTFVVAFKPAAAGARIATVTVTSNAEDSPQRLTATGNGVASAAPPSTQGKLTFTGVAAFGSQSVGTFGASKFIVASNIGSSPVTVQSIVSSNSPEFPILYSTCSKIDPAASCTFAVAFKPAAAGTRSATLTVTSDGESSPQTLSASGLGISGNSDSPAGTIDLVEYHHATWNHYFLTGNADEIAKLDGGVFAGWGRTGQQFKAFPSGGAVGMPVCRFFSTSFAPRSSHFYTSFANECTVVSGNRDWLLEDGDVFMIHAPAVDGTCGPGTDPVYRLYNNGEGAAPNHRYTTDVNLRTLMIQQGWIPEGHGPVGVIMCSPQ